MMEMARLLQQWQVDEREVREQMYRAPTPRERERWHVLWLLARGWNEQQVAEAWERDPHTIGEWLAEFRRVGPAGLHFVRTGGSPPPSARRPRPR
jgi:transposase